MQRIQSTSAVAFLPPTPPLLGVVGFFSNGLPGSRAPTTVPDWWLNVVQEELCAFLSAAGLPIDGTASAIQGAAIVGTRAAIFNTSTTWTVPVGVTRIRVERLYAGGGGGGYGNYGAGGGGGAGGHADCAASVSPGSTLTITIGGYGMGGTSTGPATAGQPSAISNGAAVLCSATAGQQGSPGVSSGLGPGGGPGVGSSSNGYFTYGSVGGDGSANSAYLYGGVGGGAFGLSGGLAKLLGPGTNAPGNTAQTGSGGGGGIGQGFGGNGGGGLCILRY